MTFDSNTALARALMLAALTVSFACKSDSTEAKAASVAGTTAKTAKIAKTPTTPTTTCIRAGTYRATSKGPFFLADEAGKLPPAADRKEKQDAVHDCAAHSSFDVTLTVATDGPTPTITFEDEMLRAESIAVSQCHLRFGVRVDDAPTMLSRAAFDLDFSTPSATATAKDVWLSIRLDGEAGENVVDCAAESIPIVLETKAGA